MDPDNDFLKNYEMQKHLKRCFLEQFKNQSLDLVLLLFESVMRIISTTGMTDEDYIRKGEYENDDMDYFSKNYRKYMEQQKKPIVKKTVNQLGWKNILRCIQVITMGLTDLVQQIIPTKVEVRVLKSLSGKVISSDSKYELNLKAE